MDYLIGMFVGIAIGSFPKLVKINNRKTIRMIETDISNMTMNRCAVVKTDIETNIKNAYLFGNINKKSFDRLNQMVRDKYNNIF